MKIQGIQEEEKNAHRIPDNLPPDFRHSRVLPILSGRVRYF